MHFSATKFEFFWRNVPFEVRYSTGRPDVVQIAYKVDGRWEEVGELRQPRWPEAVRSHARLNLCDWLSHHHDWAESICEEIG